MYLDLKEQPRFEKKITAAYYLSFICQGLTGSIFGPSMIWFAQRTHSTIAEITPILICYNLGFIFASLLISNLFDRKPGNRLIACSICVLIAVMPGLCLVTQKWQLFSLVWVMGMALSVIDNGGNILFPWLLRERSKRPMNLVHLFYSVGCIITPFLIGLALKRWNQITPVFLLLAAVLIYPAWLLFRLPSPHPLHDSSTAVSAESRELGLKQVYAAGFYALLLFLFSACQSTFNNWISTVLIRNELADESAAAMMTSIFWIGSFTGRLLVTWLVEKRRPEQIVFCCLTLAVANSIVMLFGKGSLMLTGLCVLLNGFATGPVLANVLSIMKERGLVSAKINGIVLAFTQLGGLVVPSLFGRIYGDSPSSYRPFVLISLFSTSLELIILMIILKRSQKTS